MRSISKIKTSPSTNVSKSETNLRKYSKRLKSKSSYSPNIYMTQSKKYLPLNLLLHVQFILILGNVTAHQISVCSETAMFEPDAKLQLCLLFPEPILHLHFHSLSTEWESLQCLTHQSDAMISKCSIIAALHNMFSRINCAVLLYFHIKS